MTTSTFPLTPRAARLVFVAGAAMLIVSLALSAFSAATVLSAPLAAGPVTVPAKVGFEGFLVDSGGVPLDGSHDLTFKIYDAATAGNALWGETHPGVAISGGLYAVQLGALTPFGANLFGGERWIGVTVDGGAELSPRTPISSVPFALNADSANKVSGTSLSGMIALFESQSGCPPGWSEVTSARGRVVVGVPAGGGIGSVVGTALSDAGLRTIGDVPQHSHVLNDPGHSHSWTDAGGGPGGVPGAQYASASYPVGRGTNNATTGLTLDSTGVAEVDVTMPYIQLMYCRLD